MVVRIRLPQSDSTRDDLIVGSVYLPYEDGAPTTEMVRLIDYCQSHSLPLLLGGDANAHHYVWGSSDINARGKALLDYLAIMGLEIFNRRSTPTFYNALRITREDITLGLGSLPPRIKNWRVFDEPSLSDHAQILFDLRV